MLRGEDDDEDTNFDQQELLSNGRKSSYDWEWLHRCTKTLVLSMAFFALGLCISIPGPTLLDLEERTNSSTEYISFIFTARSLGYLLGSVVGGVLFDYFDQQILLFYVLLFTGFATIAVPWCKALVVLAVFIAFQGLAVGVLDTGGNMFCIKIWGRASAPYMQTLHFAFGVGAFLAPLLARPFLLGDISNSTLSLTGHIPVNTKLPNFSKTKVGNNHNLVLDLDLQWFDDWRHGRYIREADTNITLTQDESESVSNLSSVFETGTISFMNMTTQGLNTTKVDMISTQTTTKQAPRPQKPQFADGKVLSPHTADGKQVSQIIGSNRNAAEKHDEENEKPSVITSTSSVSPITPLLDLNKTQNNNMTSAAANGTNIQNGSEFNANDTFNSSLMALLTTVTAIRSSALPHTTTIGSSTAPPNTATIVSPTALPNTTSIGSPTLPNTTAIASSTVLPNTTTIRSSTALPNTTTTITTTSTTPPTPLFTSGTTSDIVSFSTKSATISIISPGLATLNQKLPVNDSIHSTKSIASTERVIGEIVTSSLTSTDTSHGKDSFEEKTSSFNASTTTAITTSVSGRKSKPDTLNYITSAIQAVKSMSKIQFAYLIIGIFLLFNAIIFLVLYCVDYRKGILMRQNLNLSQHAPRHARHCQISILFLLFIFCFLYAGVETTFGGLLATFAVESEMLQWNRQQAATLAALFWGSIAVGRGFAIFVARCFKPPCMLVTNMILMLIGGLLLSFTLQVTSSMLWIGTVTLGFGMSSTFPTTVSWADHHYPLTGRSTTVFIMGSAIGEMTLPVLTGYLFENLSKMSLMFVVLTLCVLLMAVFFILQCIAFHYPMMLSPSKKGFIPLHTDEEDRALMDDLNSVQMKYRKSGLSESTHRRKNLPNNHVEEAEGLINFNED